MTIDGKVREKKASITIWDTESEWKNSHMKSYKQIFQVLIFASTPWRPNEHLATSERQKNNCESHTHTNDNNERIN